VSNQLNCNVEDKKHTTRSPIMCKRKETKSHMCRQECLEGVQMVTCWILLRDGTAYLFKEL